MQYNKENLLSLPVDEKPELVTALWESIDNDTLGKELSGYQFEQEIANRINNIIKSPETLIDWEEVKN